VTFTGFLGEGELAAVIAAMDALVVPSIYEPFGLVALEGASTGTPLAVAATGGLAEIVQPGVTGVTFPAKNPDALADAVSALLADKISAGRLAKRARAGGHRAVRLGQRCRTHRTVIRDRRARRAPICRPTRRRGHAARTPDDRRSRRQPSGGCDVLTVASPLPDKRQATKAGIGSPRCPTASPQPTTPPRCRQSVTGWARAPLRWRRRTSRRPCWPVSTTSPLPENTSASPPLRLWVPKTHP
jgi:glycosyl transferase family 1